TSSTISATQTSTTASPSPPANVVVATGSFEVHEFDHATVVAQFVFSFLRSNSYSETPVTPATSPVPGGCATGSTAPTCFQIRQTSQRFQPHVLLGIDYYFRPKDSFPKNSTTVHPSKPVNDFRVWLGILGGVSLTAFIN